MNPLFRCLLVVAALLSAPANAITRTWPGAAPCAGTLQNCIQGAADGDRIEIATDTPIVESISIYSKNLDVTAAVGYRPSLSSGQSVSVSSAPISGNLTTRVSGLRVVGGYVSARYLGLGTANFTVSNMVIDRGSSGRGGYLYSEVTSGTLNLVLENNRVDCGTSMFQPYAIGVESSAGSTLNAHLLYNQVRCSALGGTVNYGILANIGNADAGAATATIKLHGNEVRVEPYNGPVTGVESFTAYAVRENPLTANAGTLTTRIYNNVAIGGNDAPSANGFMLMVKRGDLDAQVVNNTASGWYQSLYAGSMVTPGSGSEAVHGIVKNNVLVSRGPAFYLQTTTTASLTNDYNLVNAPSYGITLGSHSITTAARLVAARNLRLRADSPAIDAADTATTGLGLAFAGLPVLDADGLRRIKGAGDDADIGAYEHGDTSFSHRVSSANSSGYITRLDAAELNGQPAARVFASIQRPASGGDYARPYGAYYQSPRWALFDQGIAALPLNAQFNLFVPAAGSGLFTHTAGGGNFFTELNHSSLNGLADRIVLVEQNWSLAAIYNAHPIAVLYSTSAGRWFIDNLDRETMLANAGFNVYVQAPSPNAFQVAASAANSNGSSLRVDHPLLDSTPCAAPLATRDSSIASNVQWRWEYVAPSWTLRSDASLPVGTRFHVVVDAAQVADCRDRIFTHGFE